MKIRRAALPPTGIGWASQPAHAGTVARLFPEQPWVWTAERAAYWREPESDWVAVADLALVGEPPVQVRWVGGYVRGGVAAGLWQALPAGTRLRFAHRGVARDLRPQDMSALSLIWRRAPLLRCSVAESTGLADRQPPLWALLATALIAPASVPLARGLASPEAVIDRARSAAARALAGLRLDSEAPAAAPFAAAAI
jgi:hypothetical protein